MIRENQRKLTRVFSILISIVLVTAYMVSFEPSYVAYAAKKQTAKNVIMMIPDGTSVEAITLARWYNGGQSLAMDEIAVGLTRTYWKNGPITDSAPGSTAYSTGHKTSDKYVGVLSEEEGAKPVATLLEASRLKGKSTGIVVTCEAMHATPADFTAHDPDRSNYNSIMKQQVYSGIDVVLGGGDEFLSPGAGDKRKDNVDLREVIKNLGYEYVTTKEDMEKSTSQKLWGMFAPRDLKYEIDRKYENSTQPTLAEMTEKAIDILSKDKDGFFLMVEGSKVDWAAHANDPVGVIGDIVAFDGAVETALKFAKEDKNTVVVISPDHGTGGLSIGSKAQDKNYSSVTFDETVNRLKAAKVTAEKATALLKDKSDGDIRNMVKELYGFDNLSDAEMALIKGGKINEVISARANVGWTTGGHVGGDVALFNYAPSGVEQLGGVVENTDVSEYMEIILGVNLEKTTERLFANAKESFEALGAVVEMDISDQDNPVLKVSKGESVLKLAGYTNKAELDGKSLTLEGTTLFIKKGTYNLEDVYVPLQAVDMFKDAIK